MSTQTVVILDQFCFFTPYYAQQEKVSFSTLHEQVTATPALFEGPHRRKPIIKELPLEAKLACKDKDVERGTTTWRAMPDGSCEAWILKWDY